MFVESKVCTQSAIIHYNLTFVKYKNRLSQNFGSAFDLLQLFVVLRCDSLALSSRLNSGETYGNGVCALSSIKINYKIIENRIAHISDLSGHVVTYGLAGQQTRNGIELTLLVALVQLHLGAAALEDDGTLGAVEAGTHGVVTLTSG